MPRLTDDEQIEALKAEAKAHRTILNRIADAVGHPRIAPGEDADSVARSVVDNVRHLHRIEEAYDAVKPPNDSLTLNAASLEHHAEHHERERGLNAEVERLKAERDALMALLVRKVHLSPRHTARLPWCHEGHAGGQWSEMARAYYFPDRPSAEAAVREAAGLAAIEPAPPDAGEGRS